MDTIKLEPCARWTDDCQGKKDYDGRLVSISTRYWPGNYSSDGQPSANAAIHINYGAADEYGFGDYFVWKEADLSKPTESEVKVAVEVWVREQMSVILTLFGIEYVLEREG